MRSGLAGPFAAGFAREGSGQAPYHPVVNRPQANTLSQTIVASTPSSRPPRQPEQPGSPAERPTWVRSLRASRFAIASTGLHLVGFLALHLLQPHAGSHAAEVIEVAIHAERTPPPVEVKRRAPPSVAPPPDRSPAMRAHDRERENAPPPSGYPAGTPNEAPPTAPPSAPPQEGPPPPGKPNLFSQGALERALPGSSATGVVLSPGTRSSWGGTTRSAARGDSDPNVRDKIADREDAAAKIHDFYDQSSGEDRARSGRVPPRWREAERQIDLAFAPTAEMVTDENRGETWLKQIIAAKPQGGATARGVDPSVEAGAENQAYAQSLAGQHATSEAAGWIRTEIEVVIDERGHVASSRFVHRTGRKKFDQAAMAAVLKAVDGHGALDEKAAVVTRWSVEASTAVSGPTSLGFGFDESTGKVNGAYPMKKEVKTRVALLSIAPKR